LTHIVNFTVVESINFLKTQEKKRFELKTPKFACNNGKFPFFFNINPIKKAILFLKNFSYGGQAPPLNTSPQTIACKVIFCPPRQK